MKQYIRFPNFKIKAVTFSYDDGVRQDKRLIEIMKKRNLKGTFNINGGYFAPCVQNIEQGRMSKEEALALYIPSGMEVAVHGYRHLSLSDVGMDLALADILLDRRELEATFGRVINGMAYANGAYNDEVVDLMKKADIMYARTVTSTERFDLPTDWLRLPATCHHNNPRLMELAKEFVGIKDEGYYWQKNLQLFYVWGHSYEFDENDNWDVIEKFAEYIGNREDIWYATNGEIFDYLQAAESLQVSANGEFVKNPSGMDVYIDFLETKVIVPAGKTVRIIDGTIVN